MSRKFNRLLAKKGRGLEMTQRLALVWIAAAVLSGSILHAQVNTGTILGTVTDQTSAVVRGATVKVTNIETGIVRTAATGARGEYRIPALGLGSYEVRAEIAGFETGVRNGITLTVGREAVVDFALNVGDVTQQVTVTAEAPLIDTTSASISGLVNSNQMREIPLNARSFLELVPLQAGAVFAESSDPSGVPNGFGKKLSVVGTRPASDSFLLDGADINNAAGVAGSAAQTMAGVETVREFRVVTNAYDSEYGHHTGGVISAVTKSGTNQIHGSLFEFLRNDNLDARNFFDRLKPSFRRNQFGVAVGGPVRKDHTFFFASYEGLRQGLGTTNIYNVPGRAMRNGIIRGESIGVNPAVRPFLDAYPLPNQPDRADGTAQYISAFTQTTSQNLGTARIDNRISDQDSLFGRYTIDDAEQFTPGGSGFNTGLNLGSPNRFVTVEETHIFSSAFLNRTHFSFSRTNLANFDSALPGFTFPKFSFSDETNVPGTISVSGFSGWGGGSTNPKRHIQNTFQFKEDFFLTKGRHSIKFGGQSERFQFNQVSDFNGGGSFSFSSPTDFLRKNVNVADFVKPGSDDIRGWRQDLIGLYVQDDINARQGLTFNLGVRYEFITTPTEVNGKAATVRDITPQHLYSVSGKQTDVGDPYILNPSLKSFAPRVGVAWSPFASGKTSFRGGFGIYYDQLLPKTYVVSGVRMEPFYSVAELFGRDVDIDFPNAYVTQRDRLVQSIGSKPQAEGLQWNLSQPTVAKWSFDIEQQIARDTTIQAGYSGTRGIHLLRGGINFNATPAQLVNGRLLILIDQPLPNPNWNRLRWTLSDGTSDYHAFRLTLNKRFSRGLQLQSAYTFSKSLDDSSSWTGGNEFGTSDQRGYRANKLHGPSAFDIRNSFYTNFVYEIPQRNWGAAGNALLGGWSLSGIVRFNSGNPVSLSADQPSRGSLTEQFVDGQTVDLVPGGNRNAIRPQNPNQYIDLSQFSYPTPFFQGNLGRNGLITPGIANTDLSLIKDSALRWLGESGKLQFRAEWFNVLNRANFGSPGVNLFFQNGNPKSTAGVITSTRTNSRQIQFALKILF